MRLDANWLGFLGGVLILLYSLYGYYKTFTDTNRDLGTFVRFMYSSFLFLTALVGVIGAVLSLFSFSIIGGIIQLAAGIAGDIAYALNVGHMLFWLSLPAILFLLSYGLLTLSGVLSVTGWAVK